MSLERFPRLVIISEVTLSQEGLGAGRTLINLFDGYPSNSLLLLAPSNYLRNYPPDLSVVRKVVSFRGDYLEIQRNQLGTLINPLIDALNLKLLNWLPFHQVSALENFAPEAILICPIAPLSLVMGAKLTNHFKCPSLIYFMDNWLSTLEQYPLSKYIEALGYRLLRRADGWLMISKQLEKDLSLRYSIIPPSSLIVHNPVTLYDKVQPYSLYSQTSTGFRIAYAGSIWPMHYDTLAKVAQAIFELQQEGIDIELVLYTDPSFWGLHQANWEKWKVFYGGLIPYKELYGQLRKADLLLVTSSFLPEYAPVIRSSVFTKVTDYMTVGKPILSCGPEYAACNAFLREWNCGLVCESEEVCEIKGFLYQQVQDRSTHQEIAQRALEVVEQNFEKEFIQSRLYDFIRKVSKISK